MRVVERTMGYTYKHERLGHVAQIGTMPIIRSESVEGNVGGGSRDSFVAMLEEFREAARLIGSLELVQTISAGIRAPDDPVVLRTVAGALADHAVHDVAFTALLRAHFLDRSNAETLASLGKEALDEGVSNIAATLMGDAPSVLAENFDCRYSYALNLIFAGDPDRARDIDLSGDGDRALVAREHVHDMLRRVDLARTVTGLGSEDLRGWHFVLTGSLLAVLSNPPDDSGMNGRFGAVADTHPLCREGISRLAALLEKIEVRLRQVITLPDRASRIMAAAAGELLDLPVVEFDDKEMPGLLVAYDLDTVPAALKDALLFKRPDQVLFVHRCDWTSPPTVGPDIVTMLTAENVSPWSARERQVPVEQDFRISVVTPASDEPPAEIGKRIVRAIGVGNIVDEATKAVEVLSRLAPLAIATRPRWYRLPFYPGSPVSSVLQGDPGLPVLARGAAAAG